jgi:hypothetical protein
MMIVDRCLSGLVELHEHSCALNPDFAKPPHQAQSSMASNQNLSMSEAAARRANHDQNLSMSEAAARRANRESPHASQNSVSANLVPSISKADEEASRRNKFKEEEGNRLRPIVLLLS